MLNSLLGIQILHFSRYIDAHAAPIGINQTSPFSLSVPDFPTPPRPPEILFCRHTKKSPIKFYLCPLKISARIAESWAKNKVIVINHVYISQIWRFIFVNGFLFPHFSIQMNQ